jgi:hypothetical protein
MTVSKTILDAATPIIEGLARSRSVNGAFAYYESGDVSQEVWYLCLEALQRYDPKIGPIENYLVRHVSNRIKNLRRDKYFRPGSDLPSSGLALTRMNLVNALPLDNGDIAENGTLLGSEQGNINPLDGLIRDETLAYIRVRLPDNLIEPFDDIICNNKVRSPLVAEVRYKVAEILVERDDCA